MGRLGGAGMALAGLIMGYISIGLSLLFIPALIIPNMMRAKITANEAAAASTVRMINTSQVTYSTTFPARGYARDLAVLGPGPSGSCGTPSEDHACLVDNAIGNASCTAGNWCTKYGYKFTMNSETRCADQTAGIAGIGCNYVVLATPQSETTGRKSYCSTADAVIRYRYGTYSQPISADQCSQWSVIY